MLFFYADILCNKTSQSTLSEGIFFQVKMRNQLLLQILLCLSLTLLSHAHPREKIVVVGRFVSRIATIE